MNSLFRALAGSVASYRDGDYSFGLSWQGQGDLGDLVASHNRLGEALRDQRLALVQRELLLDTMVQNTPVATNAAATACSRSATRTTRRSIISRGACSVSMAGATNWSCCASSPPNCGARKCRPGRR
jgi:hypothetical protein